MGEVQYVWADPANAQQQVALSSIVKAMKKENVMAIARWVSKDGMDPKMGVLEPCTFDLVDCLLWSHVSLFPRLLNHALTSRRCHLLTMYASTHLRRWTAWSRRKES